MRNLDLEEALGLVTRCHCCGVPIEDGDALVISDDGSRVYCSNTCKDEVEVAVPA